MASFLFRRFIQSVVSLWVLVSIVFFASRLIGDPTVSLLPLDATPDVVAAAMEQLGLDQPILVQYGRFLRNGLTGDLGTAFFWRRPVSELLWSRLPASLALTAAAMVVAALLSFAPGLYAAVKRGTAFDFLARGVVVLGGSMPAFLIGLGLIFVFGVRLRWFPVSGFDNAKSLVLPAIALGWAVAGNMMRLTRSAMLEVLDKPYIKLARIKGASAFTVHWRHGLRNGLIPVVTYSASIAARLLGAAVVVETVFAWPGLGRLLIQAVAVRDFPTIQGVVFVLGAFLILLTTLLDLTYAALNPKIKLR